MQLSLADSEPLWMGPTGCESGDPFISMSDILYEFYYKFFMNSKTVIPDKFFMNSKTVIPDKITTFTVLQLSKLLMLFLKAVDPIQCNIPYVLIFQIHSNYFQLFQL